jgi:dihydroorotate dehydrogenase (fumarate)
MPSLYEEQMLAKSPEVTPTEQLYSQAWSAGFDPTTLRAALSPRQYLQRLERIKSKTSIPVIGSISCVSLGDWVEYARMIQDTGASALELNVYFTPTDPSLTSADIEKRVVDIVAAVRGRVHLPLAVKLSPFYTALPHLVAELTRAGVNGLVLFTRTYQSDINVAKREAASHVRLSQVSDHGELLLRLRWMAMLSPWTKLSLALTGGVHTGIDAIKGILAGAHVVQVVSALLNVGPSYIRSLLEQFEEQMKRTGATSVSEIRGCLNAARQNDPSASERADYVRTLHSWPVYAGRPYM